MNIIYEDKRIIIVDKPAGLLSHHAKGRQMDDLLSELGHPGYCLVSRLDYQTSGLLLVAKDNAAASVLNRLVSDGAVQKVYMAVLSGYLPKSADTLHSWLLKDEKSAVVRITDTPSIGTMPIETKYRVLREHAGLTLAEITLITGRTHQIRAQMAKIGHPVVGDPLYGDLRLNRKMNLEKQALVSMEITFHVPDEANLFHYLDNRTFSKDKFPFSYLID